jgi:hypothetical protein
MNIKVHGVCRFSKNPFRNTLLQVTRNNFEYGTAGAGHTTQFIYFNSLVFM